MLNTDATIWRCSKKQLFEVKRNISKMFTIPHKKNSGISLQGSPLLTKFALKMSIFQKHFPKIVSGF